MKRKAKNTCWDQCLWDEEAPRNNVMKSSCSAMNGNANDSLRGTAYSTRVASTLYNGIEEIMRHWLAVHDRGPLAYLLKLKNAKARAPPTKLPERIHAVQYRVTT